MTTITPDERTKTIYCRFTFRNEFEEQALCMWGRRETVGNIHTWVPNSLGHILADMEQRHTEPRFLLVFRLF